jgi:hypothetical protein
MSGSPWFKDVNLVTSDAATLGERPLRRFAVEFLLREEEFVRRAPGAGTKSPQGIFQNVSDPFRLPASFDPAPKPPAGAPAQAGADKAKERAEASRAALGLRVQSIMAGSRKACMINNKLLRVGDQVEGFTVEEIDAGSVVVRRGDYKFMIRPKQ